MFIYVLGSAGRAEPFKYIWQFTFCFEPERTFYNFFLRPKVDDFLRWKGMPGGVVYGRMMDLCCLYGPETTDSMDMVDK